MAIVFVSICLCILTLFVSVECTTDKNLWRMQNCYEAYADRHIDDGDSNNLTTYGNTFVDSSIETKKDLYGVLKANTFNAVNPNKLCAQLPFEIKQLVITCGIPRSNILSDDNMATMLGFLSPLLMYGTQDLLCSQKNLAKIAYYISDGLMRNKKYYLPCVRELFCIDKIINKLENPVDNQMRVSLDNFKQFRQLLFDNLCWRYTVPIKFKPVSYASIDETTIKYEKDTNKDRFPRNYVYHVTTGSKMLCMLENVMRYGPISTFLLWLFSSNTCGACKTFKNVCNELPEWKSILCGALYGDFAFLVGAIVRLLKTNTNYSNVVIPPLLFLGLTRGAIALTSMESDRLLLQKCYKYIYFDPTISRALVPNSFKNQSGYDQIVINEYGCYVNDLDGWYKITIDKCITLQNLVTAMSHQAEYKKMLLERTGEHIQAFELLQRKNHKKNS